MWPSLRQKRNPYLTQNSECTGQNDPSKSVTKSEWVYLYIKSEIIYANIESYIKDNIHYLVSIASYEVSHTHCNKQRQTLESTSFRKKYFWFSTKLWRERYELTSQILNNKQCYSQQKKKKIFQSEDTLLTIQIERKSLLTQKCDDKKHIKGER